MAVQLACFVVDRLLPPNLVTTLVNRACLASRRKGSETCVPRLAATVDAPRGTSASGHFAAPASA